MIVKKIEGTVVLIWEETSSFSRGKHKEYLALKPDLAIALGKELIQNGKELLDAENTRAD